MAREAARKRPPLAAVTSAQIDAETRVNNDHHLSLRLWLRILSCTNQIETQIRQNLQSRFATTLPRFDLIAQLERARDGLKMSELSQRLMVTGGNVTGITNSLEKEGMVVREVDPNDRRVFRVKLTAKGQKQFQRMAAEHEKWIIDLFSSLTDQQKIRLFDLLGELKSHVSGSAAGG